MTPHSGAEGSRRAETDLHVRWLGERHWVVRGHRLAVRDPKAVTIPKVSAVSTWPAVVALIAATAVRGSTFVVTKQSLAQIAPATFLAWRFGIAAAVLVAIRPAKVRALSSGERRRGLGLGLLLGSGFLLRPSDCRARPPVSPDSDRDSGDPDTGGRRCVLLRASRSGGVGGRGSRGCRRGPRSGRWGTDPYPGALLTLAGAVCFTGRVTGLSGWATKDNAHGITALSVSVAAVACGATTLFAGDLTLPPTGLAWGAVVSIALAATCFGFVVQAWAQSTLTAAAAAVVMTWSPCSPLCSAALWPVSLSPQADGLGEGSSSHPCSSPSSAPGSAATP